MNASKLIGMRVQDCNTHAIGEILAVQDGIIDVDYHGTISKYKFPSAFAECLEIEDENLQRELLSEGEKPSFDSFRRTFSIAIDAEINYLKSNVGKKYRIVDGERLQSRNGEYLYSFDADTDFHFPEGTAIKLWFPGNIVTGYVISCEDFTLQIRTTEFIGDNIESVEFTSEQWQLLEMLKERLYEMNPASNSLAYQVACCGKRQISEWGRIQCGQNAALSHATSNEITFIWGPPGTGKTETLANIALEHIQSGKRVLILSYSNVSVDGALLRIAKKADSNPGSIIRYGYPRMVELLESNTLTSYQYVINQDESMSAKYRELIEYKKRLRKKDPERIAVNKQLNQIRGIFLEKEKELIQTASLVATTASKAIADKAIYLQNFDVVIFDEASMAYIPQIVVAAGLAKKHFICLGDFCQLPAIVQNQTDDRLSKDIFEHVGITHAVNSNCSHEWLVMLDLQYRMHCDIANFVSKNMYQGRLRTADGIIKDRNEIASCRPCSGDAMALVDLSGLYSVCTKTMDGSRINILSAMTCLRLAEMNIGLYGVGIITPYSAQSRLILSMIRDIQKTDSRWMGVSCATVHQFQGSEKPIIIYDAVDCFRMPFPGMLLTSMKNDSANRLFNVAVTRAKGKFLLVANIDYLQRKKISSKLLLSKAIKQMCVENASLPGERLLNEMLSLSQDEGNLLFSERELSWNRFIGDIKNAKSEVRIDIPDVIYEHDNATAELGSVLDNRERNGVKVCIRCFEDVDLPKTLGKYTKKYAYVTNPITIVDKEVVWFGQPLYAADFISEGGILSTKFFPCVRFVGKHTARSIQAFLEM